MHPPQHPRQPAALAAGGVLAKHDLLMPPLIIIPVARFALAYRTMANFRSHVLSLDTGILVILYSWRMLGLGFLLLFAHDILPDCLPGWPVRETHWPRLAPL